VYGGIPPNIVPVNCISLPAYPEYGPPASTINGPIPNACRWL